MQKPNNVVFTHASQAQAAVALSSWWGKMFDGNLKLLMLRLQMGDKDYDGRGNEWAASHDDRSSGANDKRDETNPMSLAWPTYKPSPLGWHNFRQSSTLSEMRDSRPIYSCDSPLDFFTGRNAPLFGKWFFFWQPIDL